jgi:macrolide-specific efflux system membrane fusion protein
MKAKRLVIFGSISLLLLAILGTWFFSKKNDTLVVVKGSLVEAIYALGMVKPELDYSLKFGISSSIRELFVKEGDRVKANDPILSNDSGIVFHTPISGIVTKLPFSKGETVMPGIVLAEVMNWEKVYIQVYLEQESAIRVKEGQPATLSFESLRGHTYKAKVDKIYPSGGQFLVRLIPEEMPEGILPEMTTDLAIQVAKKENVVLVPLIAVDNGKVIRMRNGKKDKIEIKIGAINEEKGELLSGDLIEGDELIINKK